MIMHLIDMDRVSKDVTSNKGKWLDIEACHWLITMGSSNWLWLLYLNVNRSEIYQNQIVVLYKIDSCSKPSINENNQKHKMFTCCPLCWHWHRYTYDQWPMTNDQFYWQFSCYDLLCYTSNPNSHIWASLDLWALLSFMKFALNKG